MFKRSFYISRLSIIAVLAINLLWGSISAFAAEDNYPSPTKSSEYTLVVYPSKGGTGTKRKIDKNYYRITAHEKKGYTFTHWIIKGKYHIKKGNLNQKILTLILRSDCEATPYFKSINNKYDNTAIKSDKNPISPKTGDIGNKPAVLMFLSVLFVFVLTAFVSVSSGAVYYYLYNRKVRRSRENE